MRSRSMLPNRAARIARLLPQRHRRRLLERVGAVLDEQREQRGRQALAHRPALELRVARDARRVPLGDDAALVDDEEGGGHARPDRRRRHRPPRRSSPRSIAGRHRRRVRLVAHRPRLRRRRRAACVVTATGVKWIPGFSGILDDAALIAVIPASRVRWRTTRAPVSHRDRSSTSPGPARPAA